jgi:intracellular sulfur oxidation DsrE/DsrF family protein
MAKVVIHLFHGDEDSLSVGSHVAERVRQVAGDQQVDLEVCSFGPAQSALSNRSDDPTRTEYNQQIDELAAAGVPVGACLNAARAAGTE